MMKLYRKRYHCICEGQQEEMYLAHVGRLLTDRPRCVVTFTTERGSPASLERAARYGEYDVVALFDHDGNHARFEENVKVCEELDRKGGKGRNRQRVFHAYSNMNFDLWLVLHKIEFTRPVHSNDAYVPVVRGVFGLEPEANIKSRHHMEKILAQISLDDVRAAITRADNIRARKLQDDGRKIGSWPCFPNPDLSIHDFLKTVLRETPLL